MRQRQRQIILHVRPRYIAGALTGAARAGVDVTTATSTRTVGDMIELTAPAWAEQAIIASVPSHAITAKRSVRGHVDGPTAIRHARRHAGLE